MTQIRDIMQKNVITIESNKTALDASIILREKEISFLVIIEDEKPTGVISEETLSEKLQLKILQHPQYYLKKSCRGNSNGFLQIQQLKMQFKRC